MALHGADAYDPVAVLPSPVAREVFKRLPADQRARAALVCRRWRAALADPSLWTELDLSSGGGVVCRVDGDAMRAAAARARGGLLKLKFTLWRGLYAALRALVAGNSATLEKLSLCLEDFTLLSDGIYREEYNTEILALLALAPTLRAFEVSDIWVGFSDALLMLRNEPPYGPLRLNELSIDGEAEDTDISGLATSVVAHKSLTKLSLHFAREQITSPAVLDLIFNAAFARCLTHLHCHGCCLTPTNAPALAQLLSSEFLTVLHLDTTGVLPPVAMLDASAAASLANALRANRTLQELALINVRLFEDVEAALMLLGAITEHASLRDLYLSCNLLDPLVHGADAISAALARLVSADSTLESLMLSYCYLGDSGVGPLVDALPSNMHLRTLQLCSNCITEIFAVHRLLPAVYANTSLRWLMVADDDSQIFCETAERFVQQREDARLAALDAGGFV